MHSSNLPTSITDPTDAKEFFHYTSSLTLPIVLSDKPSEHNSPNAVNPTTVVRCVLNYETFPTILFHCLPLRAQRLIGHRVKKSPCPLFVLVTSSHGQWCLVQLIDSDYIHSDQAKLTSEPVVSHSESIQTPDFTQPDENENTTSTDWSSERMAALRVNLDDYSQVEFSGSGAAFQLKAAPDESAWRCPFCGASFTMDNSTALPDLLAQHLRLHVELRCCMDCATLLPNNTLTTELDSQAEHKCSQLVSPTRKNHTDKQSLLLPFSPQSFTPTPPKSHDLLMPISSKVVSVSTENSHSPGAGYKEIAVNYALPLNATVAHIQPAHTASTSPAECSGTISQLTEPIVPDFHPYEVAVHKTQAKVPYCLRCNMQFKTSAQYQQHLKNVHRGHRFVCQQCDVSFSTKGNLTTHFQQVHNRSAAMRCPICDKRLSNKYNIERHMRFVHGTVHANQTSSETTVDTGNPFTLTTQRQEASRTHPLGSLELRDELVPTGDRTDKEKILGGKEASRGFYLYLSNPDQTEVLVKKQSNPTGPRRLVAEVQMTPCPPNNPNAQYGSGGTTWSPCVRVAEPWLISSPDSRTSYSSPPHPPPT